MSVFTQSACLRHDPGAWHPESPERLLTLLDRLESAGITVAEAKPASRSALLRVHPASYLERLEAVASAGGGRFDADTIMGPATWEAAVGGAGAALAAVQSALDSGSGFAAVRPPGHHALAGQAMGFCFLANAVIAAREAQATGLPKVLIIDWDVHHGNGTQALVQDDPSVRYVSLHEWPAYPGTGAASERGCGNLFNVPMGPGLPRLEYVERLWVAIGEATAGWLPECVIISAGYDAMAGDPLAGFTLEPEDYAEWTRRVRALLPDVPIAAVLEGGYVPSRLADGVLATVTAFG